MVSFLAFFLPPSLRLAGVIQACRAGCVDSAEPPGTGQNATVESVSLRPSLGLGGLAACAHCIVLAQPPPKTQPNTTMDTTQTMRGKRGNRRGKYANRPGDSIKRCEAAGSADAESQVIQQNVENQCVHGQTVNVSSWVVGDRADFGFLARASGKPGSPHIICEFLQMDDRGRITQHQKQGRPAPGMRGVGIVVLDRKGVPIAPPYHRFGTCHFDGEAIRIRTASPKTRFFEWCICTPTHVPVIRGTEVVWEDFRVDHSLAAIRAESQKAADQAVMPVVPQAPSPASPPLLAGYVDAESMSTSPTSASSGRAAGVGDLEAFLHADGDCSSDSGSSDSESSTAGLLGEEQEAGTASMGVGVVEQAPVPVPDAVPPPNPPIDAAEPRPAAGIVAPPRVHAPVVARQEAPEDVSSHPFRPDGTDLERAVYPDALPSLPGRFLGSFWSRLLGYVPYIPFSQPTAGEYARGRQMVEDDKEVRTTSEGLAEFDAVGSMWSLRTGVRWPWAERVRWYQLRYLLFALPVLTLWFVGALVASGVIGWEAALIVLVTCLPFVALAFTAWRRYEPAPSVELVTHRARVETKFLYTAAIDWSVYNTMLYRLRTSPYCDYKQAVNTVHTTWDLYVGEARPSQVFKQMMGTDKRMHAQWILYTAARSDLTQPLEINMQGWPDNATVPLGKV